LLATNDFEKAKAQAQLLRDTRYWKDVIAALKEHMADQCSTCGYVLEVIVNPITLSVIAYCPVCYEKEEKEKELIEMQGAKNRIAEKIDLYLRERGVPRRFLNAKMRDFPPTWQKLKESTEGIFLTGSRGVGKTHLAVALMREMILSTQPVNHSGTYKVDIQKMPLFISVPELLLEIRDTFDGNEISEKAVIDKYSWIDMLILDDLGVEKTSDWVLQTLYTIMDRRYREELRTIITSNLSIEEIQEKLDDRIASRIVGMCRVCILQGRDRRLH
jgi:DNA replication protein DnaC